MVQTYVADVNGLASLCSGRCVVGEGVRGGRGSTSIEPTTLSLSSESSTASIAAATTKPTAGCKSTSATIATTKPSTASKSTAATIAATHTAPGKAVFADLEHTPLPVIPVELRDSGPSVVRGFEHDYSGALGTSVLALVDIGANNTTCAGCVVQYTARFCNGR